VGVRVASLQLTPRGRLVGGCRRCRAGSMGVCCGSGSTIQGAPFVLSGFLHVFHLFMSLTIFVAVMIDPVT
jgi:hypothetical protein